MNEHKITKLNPLIVPINAHIYISSVSRKLVFDSEDAMMQIMRNQDIMTMLRLNPEKIDGEELKLRDET